MSYNITSFLSNGKYIYQQWNEGASGSSGSSGAMETSCACGSGIANASNYSWVSGGTANTSAVSGSSGHYEQIGTAENLNVDQLIELFTKGNMIASEVEKMLQAHKNEITNVNAYKSGNMIRYTFRYNNTNYSIACSNDAAASQLDYKEQQLFTKSQLRYSYGINDENINKYFSVAFSDGSNLQFAFNPDYGFKSIYDVFAQIQSDNTKNASGTSGSSGSMNVNSSSGASGSGYVSSYYTNNGTNGASGTVSSDSMNASFSANNSVNGTSNSSASASINTASNTSDTLNTGNTSNTSNTSAINGPNNGGIMTVREVEKRIGQILDDVKEAKITPEQAVRKLRLYGITVMSDIDDGTTVYTFTYNKKDYMFHAPIEEEPETPEIPEETESPEEPEGADGCRRGNIWDDEEEPVLSKEEINLYVKLLKESIPDITAQKVEKMAESIANLPGADKTDKTEYVSIRLFDFLHMQAVNPNMSVSEMNMNMALNKVLTLSLNSVAPVVAELFNTDITSFDDLFYFQDLEKLLMDEYPQAREAYIQTYRLQYLSAAQNGELTKEDYYEFIKIDLFDIFPNSRDVNESDKKVLCSQIDCLSPDEIEYFITKAMNLPGCYENEYEDALNEFLTEFNNAVNGKTAYTLTQPKKILSLSEVFTSLSGTEFHPDSIIEANSKLEKLENAIDACATYQTALNIIESVENGEKDISTALWQIGFLYTGSTNAEDIESFLKRITDNNDLYVENGKVIIPQPAFGRTNSRNNTPQNNESSVWNSVVNWCGDTFKGVVDLCVSESVQETWKNANLTTLEGFVNFAGDLLNDPNFYKDIGEGLLLGAGIVATGGLGTGVLIAASVGTAAVVSGATCDFVQQCCSEKGITADNVTNYAATLSSAALDFYGVKFATAAFELPSAVKGVINKITNKINSSINKFTVNNPVFNSDDIQHLEELAEAVKTGKFFEKNKWYYPNSVEGSPYANPGDWIDIPDEVRNFLKNNVLDNINNVPETVINGLKTRKVHALSDGYKYMNYTDDELMQLLTSKYNDLSKVQYEFNRIKQEINYVKDMLKYAKANKTKTPITLFRGEDRGGLNRIDIQGKSLLDWLEDCEQANDYSELLNLLNSGNYSYKLEREMGTSILSGHEFQVNPARWEIKAQQGTEGIFADMVSSFHNGEWEFMLTAGQKLNITGAKIVDGKLFIDAVVEASTQSGQTIYKKVAIVIAIATSGTTVANAQTPQEPEPTPPTPTPPVKPGAPTNPSTPSTPTTPGNESDSQQNGTYDEGQTGDGTAWEDPGVIGQNTGGNQNGTNATGNSTDTVTDNIDETEGLSTEEKEKIRSLLNSLSIYTEEPQTAEYHEHVTLQLPSSLLANGEVKTNSYAQTLINGAIDDTKNTIEQSIQSSFPDLDLEKLRNNMLYDTKIKINPDGKVDIDVDLKFTLPGTLWEDGQTQYVDGYCFVFSRNPQPHWYYDDIG